MKELQAFPVLQAFIFISKWTKRSSDHAFITQQPTHICTFVHFAMCLYALYLLLQIIAGYNEWWLGLITAWH